MGTIVDKLKSPLGFLFPGSHKEDLVAEHIIREHRRGRSIDDILQDAYVKNTVSDDRINRILSRQDVVESVGKDLDAVRTPPAG